MGVWKEFSKRHGQNVYFITFTMAGGKRKSEKVGLDRKKARALLLQRNVEVANGTYIDPKKPRDVGPTFGAVFEQFLAGYRSRGGTDYYHHVLKAARRFFENTPLADLDTRAVDRYLEGRRAAVTKGVPRKVSGETVMVGAGRRSVGESTLRKEIIALGTCFRWLKRRGMVAVNPVADYEKPRDPAERNIAILAPEQEEALKAACPPWVWDVVAWALYSGMRYGEVLALRWRDIDQARGVVHVAGAKTGRARTVPLGISAKLAATLARRPHHIGSDLVFCERDGKPLDRDALNGLLEGAARAAGIAKERGVQWNRFRHTWATRLAATGKVSLFEISKWMGNSVAICERHYAAYLPGAHEKVAGILDAPSVPPPGDGVLESALVSK